jgi:hypothetical protein
MASWMYYTSPEKVHLERMDKYFIYLTTNRGTQIKDKNIVIRNRTFDKLIHYESR